MLGREYSKLGKGEYKYMITKYVIHYKDRPITEPLTLPEAMKRIEKLRCLLLGIIIVPVEVAE